MSRSGEQALELYNNQDFDVALIDLRLPGIDGLETARRIAGIARNEDRARPGMICVTADTAVFSDPAVNDAFDAVVSKPIRQAPLMQQIARVRDDAVGAAGEAALPTRRAFDRELAEAFLEIVVPQRVELERSIQEGRFGDARLLAHRFAGQVGYFSRDDLQSGFARLESLCVEEDTEKIGPCFLELLASLDALITTLGGETNPGGAPRPAPVEPEPCGDTEPLGSTA